MNLRELELQVAKNEVTQMLEHNSTKSELARAVLADDDALNACAKAAIDAYNHSRVRDKVWQKAIYDAVKNAKKAKERNNELN